MTAKPPTGTRPHTHPFRRAVLRGFAVILPPLLTVVIFVWIGSTVNQYVLQPVTAGVREMLVLVASDIQRVDQPATGTLPRQRYFDDRLYQILPSNDDAETRQYVPVHVYRRVANQLHGDENMPASGRAVYRQYVNLRFLQPQYVIPMFVCVFVLILYLLGKFLAAGIGRFFLISFERVVNRLPLIRNVYGSVKQVTDFVFSESQVEYTRVVALEYPRKGVWSLGLVTGESMLDISSAANEPVLSVLIPSSPMPVTGYTITIKKSEALDLNLTIDQAFQFVVSCGVVVPAHQMQIRGSSQPNDEAAGSSQLEDTKNVSRLPPPESGNGDDQSDRTDSGKAGDSARPVADT